VHSANTSFHETVRGGKYNWRNSTTRLSAAAPASVRPAISHRPGSASSRVSAPIAKNASGMNSSRFATRSARFPTPRSKYGVAANARTASSNGR